MGAYETSRADFVAAEVAWRRLVGDVTVSHFPRSTRDVAHDSLSMTRYCSPSAGEEVGMQMLRLALQYRAYLTTSVWESEVHFRLMLSCREGVIEAPSEADTDRIEVPL